MLVYRHRRLDTNEIFYIGIGNKTRPYRKSNRSQYWNNIVNKTDYEVEILAENLDEEDAKELEIFLISLYGRRDLGKGTLVNLTDGGDGTSNVKQSEESKKKRADKLRGIKRPKEVGEKISKSLTGRKLSAEHIEKTRISSTGRIVHTEEDKEVLRQRWTGEGNPNYGKIFSKEDLEKISEPILQYSIEGEFIKEWIGAMEASKVLGVCNSSICMVCRGKRNKAGGFVWKYKNETL